MSTQRYIDTSFWDDAWVQDLDPSEKLLYIYLLTNPLTNIAGVYKITKKRICFDTGFNFDTVGHILNKFSNDKKAYMFGEFVIIKNWPKNQKWETSSKIKDGIISILQDLPEEVFEYLLEIDYAFDLTNVKNTVISNKMRKKISGTTIKRVFEKYENKCSVCNSVENLNIHHIKRIKDGGDNSFNNLTLLCQNCHIKLHQESDSQSIYPIGKSTYPSNYLNLNLDLNSNLDLNNTSEKEEKKPKKLPLKDREPENDFEKIEKTYLTLWDYLYSHKLVVTDKPIITNWVAIRKLEKELLSKIPVESIIQAVQKSINNDFVIQKGYSLQIILSSNVMNQLVNGNKSSKYKKSSAYDAAANHIQSDYDYSNDGGKIEKDGNIGF